MRTPGPAAAFSRATIVPRWPAAAGTSLTAHSASLAEAGLAAAVLRVVGADVEGDQEHPAAVGLQEADRRGQLRPGRVAADPAVDHADRGLARAAQLDQPQPGAAGTQRRVDLVRVTVRGLHADADRVGLDAPGQRVAQGEVVGGGRGLGRRIDRRRAGGRRARARGEDHGRSGDGRDGFDGLDGGQREARHADGSHRHLPETATACPEGRPETAISASSLTARFGWPSEQVKPGAGAWLRGERKGQR